MPQAAERVTLQAGFQPVTRLASPTARTYIPCGRCLHCPCRQPTNFSEAQREYPPLRLSRSTSPHNSPSLGPPQLWPEGPTDNQDTMSLGSGGSPIDFIDPATYEAILVSLRDDPGQTPAFSGSPPGTPPQLSLETTTRDGRHTQTGATFSREKSTMTFVDVTHTATQVACRPHL